jgi:SAM-dependent methyltransferase
MRDSRWACPVCAGECVLLDVVDFNKSCEEANGKRLPAAGIPVAYVRCPICEFCFAPEFADWSLEEFDARIYNDEYVSVDPEYIEIRPRLNAKTLLGMFPSLPASVRHLDYGGGNGRLAGLLRESGWSSVSYDPFVDRAASVERLGKFDLITAFEVFEHVPDVRKLMSDLRSLLAPGGLILFSTLPSDGQIHAGQKLTWWYASPRNGHISLFSIKSLALLAEQSGWHLGRVSQGFHAFGTTLAGWAEHITRPA